MLMIAITGTEKAGQHEHAHRLLRECLRPLDIVYPCELSRGEHGKPFLADHPEVHFNLSHADGIAACIAGGRECGIDCERVREYRPQVMRRAFSEDERKAVEAAGDQRDLLFFRLWTLKEAYIKAIGTGLSFPMNRVCFDLSEGNIISNVTGWDFRQYVLRNGEYVVSICEQSVNNSL